MSALAVLYGEGFRLRRAEPGDVEFLASLSIHQDVEPFLAAISARSHEELLEQIRLSQEVPTELGRFLLELEIDGSWTRAGALAFEVSNRRSRIAWLHAVMLEPEFRGRGLALRAVRLLSRHLIRDLGFHRVQLEVYGFNEQALRLFERAGFTREGAKRKAYWRHGAWHDGVLFGLLADELGDDYRGSAEKDGAGSPTGSGRRSGPA